MDDSKRIGTDYDRARILSLCTTGSSQWLTAVPNYMYGIKTKYGLTIFYPND